MAEPSQSGRPMRVALFVTCLGDVFYPEVGEAVVRVLRRLGVEVDFPTAQTCCGQPAFNAGFRDQARAVARHQLEVLAPYEYVVVPSGSCASMFRVFYPELFAGDATLDARANALAERVYEFSEFIVRVLGVSDVGAAYEGKVAYHASCHLLRELGVDEPPQRLLQSVRGAEATPMDLESQCCGFGGTFAVKYPDISDAMLKKKIDSLKRAGADTLVSCDAGCLMHIAGRLRRQGDRIRVMHLAELLSQEDRRGAFGN